LINLFFFYLKQPIVYEFIFFLQAMGQIQVAASFSSSSGFHMVLGILMCGQYNDLFFSLVYLKYLEKRKTNLYEKSIWN